MDTVFVCNFNTLTKKLPYTDKTIDMSADLTVDFMANPNDFTLRIVLARKLVHKCLT